MINNLARYSEASFIESLYSNDRPDENDISLLVIHCISLPEGVYGGGQIKQLFTGNIDCDEHPTFESLKGVKVSAHCVIYRDGSIDQFVPFNKRAWHAGVSSFDGVDGCNDFSIGIELEGTDKTPYTADQYQSLARISRAILIKYPEITTKRIKAHSEIAPGRKTDPGECFDWDLYFKQLKS